MLKIITKVDKRISKENNDSMLKMKLVVHLMQGMMTKIKINSDHKWQYNNMQQVADDYRPNLPMKMIYQTLSTS